ncbi:MAG: hypothetical protein KDD61_17425 [Bdellovibrionales bacterium]|nr:hypothetical protein [Bdellovibrionales bacterium]
MGPKTPSSQWLAFFQQARLNRFQFEAALDRLVKEWDKLENREDKVRVLKEIAKIRYQLPVVAQWILASLEVEVHAVSTETTMGAREALEQVKPTSHYTFLSGRPKVTRVFLYGGEDAKELARFEFSSEAMALRHYRNWVRLPSLQAEISREEFWLERQLQWITYLSERTYHIPTSLLITYLQDFNKPGMKLFVSPQRLRKFHEAAVYLVSRVVYTYGTVDYEDTSNTNLKVRGNQRSDFLQLRDLVKQWILSDIEFLIQDFDRLTRRELIEPTDILNRGLNEAEMGILKDFVAGQRKTDNIGRWIASILLFHQLLIENKEVPKTVFETAMEGLMRAKSWSKGVRVNLSQGEGAYLMASTYHRFSWQLYLVLEKSNLANPLPLLKEFLKSHRTIRTSKLSLQAWRDLELKRLTTLAHFMDRQELTEYVKGVLSDSKQDLGERLVLASFYRHVFQASNLELQNVATAYKQSQMRTIGFFRKRQVLWSENSEEIVRTLVALYPQDRDLQNLLQKVFHSSTPINGISPRAAREWLRVSESYTKESKEQLVRQLMVLRTGDARGDFKALISVDSEAGKEVTEIVFVHRRDTTKLIAILNVLIDEAAERPQILEAIKKAEPTVRPEVAEALYSGKTLYEWLKEKIDERRQEEILSGGKCARSV